MKNTEGVQYRLMWKACYGDRNYNNPDTCSLIGGDVLYDVV